MSINTVAHQGNQQNHNRSMLLPIAAGVGVSAFILIGGGVALYNRSGPKQNSTPVDSAKSRTVRAPSRVLKPTSPTVEIVSDSVSEPRGTDAEQTGQQAYDGTVRDQLRRKTDSTVAALPVRTEVDPQRYHALAYLDLASAGTSRPRSHQFLQEAPASLPSESLQRAAEFGREHATLLKQPVVRERSEFQGSLIELAACSPQRLADTVRDGLSLHPFAAGQDGTAFALHGYPEVVGRATTRQIEQLLETDLRHPGGVAVVPVRYDERLSPVGNDATFGVPQAVVLRADDPRVRDGYVHAADVDFEKSDANVLAWLMPNCAGSHPVQPDKALHINANRASLEAQYQDWENNLSPEETTLLQSARKKEEGLLAKFQIDEEDIPEGLYLLPQCSDALSLNERAMLLRRDAQTKPLRQAKAIRQFYFRYLYSGGMKALHPDDLLNGQRIADLDAQAEGNRFRALMKEFAKGPSMVHCNPRSSVLYRKFFSAEAGKAIASYYERHSRDYTEKLTALAELPQATFDHLAGSLAILHKTGGAGSARPVTIDYEHTGNMFEKNGKLHLIDLAFADRRSAPGNTSALLRVFLNGHYHYSPLTTIAKSDEAAVRAASQKLFNKVSAAAKSYHLPEPKPSEIHGLERLGPLR